MISLSDYWMGRDAKYADDLTTEIMVNAAETVEKWNRLLAIADTQGVPVFLSKLTGTPVSSGWRPPEINEATSNAAALSKHLSGQACDIYDPYGDLAIWLAQNLSQAADIGLWVEDFRCTRGWVHGQTVPPKSGKRVYIPSLAWAEKLATVA